MSDQYPEAKIMRNEYGNLQSQILTEIVKPYLSGIIRESSGEISNKSSLHAAFKTKTGSTVSFSTFNVWLEILGIQFRKVIQIDGINPANVVPAVGGGGSAPRPQAEPEVRFDNEEPMDFRPSRGYGDAFGEIARQGNQ